MYNRINARGRLIGRCYACCAPLIIAASLTAQPARADVSRADTPDTHASDGFRGELGAAPLITAGLMPGLGSGVSLFTGYRWTSVSVTLEARLLASFDQQLTRNVVIDASIAMPTLHVCGHRAALSACAVFDVGELRTESSERLRIDSHNPWGASIGLRSGAEWPFSEYITLRGFIEVHAQFGRPSMWVNNAEAWGAPPLFGVFGVGLMLPLGTL